MHSSRFEYEIFLISIVQPTNRTKHKTKQKKKKNQTHKPIQSQKTIKFWSFLTILLEIQYRNQNRKKLGETKVSLIFPTISRQPNSELCTKRLTFFFIVLRDRVDWRNLKLCTPCCGFIKSFGEGDECEIVEIEWENSEWERLRFSVRVRAWDCLLCVRERVSESGECLICVRGVNFEKTPTWNRVLETRFPIFPRGPTTSHPNGHIT